MFWFGLAGVSTFDSTGVIPLKNAAVKLLPEWQGKRHALIVNTKDREFVMIGSNLCFSSIITFIV
jgi:hypothetical protein